MRKQIIVLPAVSWELNGHEKLGLGVLLLNISSFTKHNVRRGYSENMMEGGENQTPPMMMSKHRQNINTQKNREMLKHLLSQ